MFRPLSGYMTLLPVLPLRSLLAHRRRPPSGCTDGGLRHGAARWLVWSSARGTLRGGTTSTPAVYLVHRRRSVAPLPMAAGSHPPLFDFTHLQAIVHETHYRISEDLREEPPGNCGERVRP